MDTSDLPTPVAEYLSANRTELFEFTETLVGYETQNPPGRTIDVVEWLEDTLGEPSSSVERFEVDPEKPNTSLRSPAGPTARRVSTAISTPSRSTRTIGRTIHWGSETATASTAAGRPT